VNPNIYAFALVARVVISSNDPRRRNIGLLALQISSRTTGSEIGEDKDVHP
jgi:hypothetical protein